MDPLIYAIYIIESISIAFRIIYVRFVLPKNYISVTFLFQGN